MQAKSKWRVVSWWRSGHHVLHQRTHGIETRDARRVHAQKWRLQVTWLVSEANAYTDLTLSEASGMEAAYRQ